MKLRNLFLASVACAGLFTACSNEMDEVVNNETNNAEVAYASFAYTLPNGSGANTRAPGDGDGDGKEAGTEIENAVKEISFVLFKANGEFIKVETLDRTDFTPDVTSSTTYKTISPIKVTIDKQNVFVIVNPSATLKGFTGTRTDFQALTETISNTGGFFTMSNANQIASYTVEPTLANSFSNPVSLTVPVERMAARIDYTATQNNNTYTVVSAPDDRVQITEYSTVNKRANAFLLKRVGATPANAVIGASEEDKLYVIDPIFEAKNDPNFFKAPASIYTSGYSNKLGSDLTYTALPTATKATRLEYCHENTMSVNAQKNGAATGLVLKAKYTPKLDGLNETGDFYRYNGVLYVSLKAMYRALNPSWNGENKENITVDVLNFKAATEVDFAKFAATFTFATLKAKHVDLYAGGICYYSTFLRHYNNNKPNEMGIMEFAIVRNNIYKLSVNTINKLGDPVAPTDPEIPVESADTYLDITVNVLNWTVRNNSVDL